MNLEDLGLSEDQLKVVAALIESAKSSGDSGRIKSLEASVEKLESMVKEVIKRYPKQVEQYKAGKEKLFGFFVGQMMQNTKGKGNPNIIQKLLKKHLS